IGADRDQLLTGLDALAHGQPAPGVVHGQAGLGKGAFLFPGQGAQWPDMAVQLLDSSAVFAEQMKACADALAPYVDWSLEEVLRGGVSGVASLDRGHVLQRTVFVLLA